jgi:hypothetical protein
MVQQAARGRHGLFREVIEVSESFFGDVAASPCIFEMGFQLAERRLGHARVICEFPVVVPIEAFGDVPRGGACRIPHLFAKLEVIREPSSLYERYDFIAELHRELIGHDLVNRRPSGHKSRTATVMPRRIPPDSTSRSKNLSVSEWLT